MKWKFWSTEKSQDPGQACIVKSEHLLVVGDNTPMMCTDCKTAEAKTYYLKRRRGLYALLCFQYGQGCWERSARTNCSYADSFGAECTFLAEYEIVSLDYRSSRVACLAHMPFMLSSGVPGHQIFPLED